MRSFGDRALAASLVGVGPCRGCAGTGREPAWQTAARRAEDLYRRHFRTGERTARTAAHAFPGKTPRPDPAVAHSSGDEHQESSPKQSAEARTRGPRLFAWLQTSRRTTTLLAPASPRRRTLQQQPHFVVCATSPCRRRPDRRARTSTGAPTSSREGLRTAAPCGSTPHALVVGSSSVLALQYDPKKLTVNGAAGSSATCITVRVLPL